eukprot:2397519-Amphidinium_carterae.1
MGTARSDIIISGMFIVLPWRRCTQKRKAMCHFSTDGIAVRVYRHTTDCSQRVTLFSRPGTRDTRSLGHRGDQSMPGACARTARSCEPNSRKPYGGCWPFLYCPTARAVLKR